MRRHLPPGGSLVENGVLGYELLVTESQWLWLNLN